MPNSLPLSCPEPPFGDVVGVLLAAGAGRRMGKPKALVVDEGAEPWALGAADRLAAAGCSPVYVVIGAAAPQVRSLFNDRNYVLVEAAEWASGMAASLRAGLEAIQATTANAALVHLVDLPDVGADAMSRVSAHASADVLARAFYNGKPSHPVLIGRNHWQPIASNASKDRGARDYLAARDVIAVDCSDLASGVDIDTPDGLGLPRMEHPQNPDDLRGDQS